MAWTAYAIDQVMRVAANAPSLRGWAEMLVYFAIATLLTGSSLAYLFARLGYLYRTRDHHRVPRATIDDFFTESEPSLTVLVPSYREDGRIIRQTLLSAALQEYPSLGIVLLVDDPPNPTTARDLELLEDARSTPEWVQQLLETPRRRFTSALEAFERRAAGEAPQPEDLKRLAEHYLEAATWLRTTADDLDLADHSDEFLAEQVFGRLASEMVEVANALVDAANEEVMLSERRVHQLHRRLVWTFTADLSVFERKQYVSLSNEPNKAMNLNSYIGLMGRKFREQETSGGRVLIEVRSGPCDLEVRDPDYVLTLDADSMLLPEYCLRLVHHMELPESSRLAVTQTPYSAFPGAPTRIERISGATTDLQHIVHQGLTRYGATFWVGANAVLRKIALDELCEIDLEDGLPIRRYIQDRTPIEDTESSIDMRLLGWQLYNFPERLSYSATPPDFGSLCIQRQRWANGGLNMLSKYRRLVRRRGIPSASVSIGEALLRLNYLAAIAWASIGLFILLAFPFDDRLISPIALTAAVPFFVAMSTDLRRSGYRRTDVFRVYGFNLLLLAVNTAGVVRSIGQSIGGQRLAFARTPKVKHRTVAPLTFIIVPYLIVALSTWTLWRDIQSQALSHAAFAASNAFLTLYALLAFVGLRYSLADVWFNIVDKLFVEDKRVAPENDPDWVSVLYFGSAETIKSSSVSSTVAALALVDQQPSEIDNLISVPRVDVGPETPPADRRESNPRRSLGGRLFGRRVSQRTDDPSDPHEALVTALSRFVNEAGGTLEVRLNDNVLSISSDSATVDVRASTPQVELPTS
ncbi:MAG: glycosyltransferase family 2 protein [Microthrixaceae bacterium]